MPTLSGPGGSPTGEFTLTWTSSSGATSYNLEQNGSTVYTGTALSYNADVQSNGEYSYEVDACDSAGCSAESNVVTVDVNIQCPDGTAKGVHPAKPICPPP